MDLPKEIYNKSKLEFRLMTINEQVTKTIEDAKNDLSKLIIISEYEEAEQKYNELEKVVKQLYEIKETVKEIKIP